MKYGYYANKDVWEANRLTAYIMAQVNSKRKLKVADIVTFPWEDKEEVSDTRISKEDIERLKKQAETYLKHNNI